MDDIGKMQEILNQLKLRATVDSVESNGTVVRYFLRLMPGGKISSIENRTKEIALALKSFNVPMVKVLTNEGLLSLELIMHPMSNVNFSDIAKDIDKHNCYLPIVIGKTYSGKNIIADLYKMPHLLVAGTTGSGKSIMLHSIICSTLMQEDVNIALIDPKMVELSMYGSVRNLTKPVATNPESALRVLEFCANEMNKRFSIFKKAKVSNIIEYRKKKKMPYLILVIDEFSDLMLYDKKMFQNIVCELAQKSRAVGIHLIIATQRPDVKTITGTIKANFQSRVCFRVPTATDSRVVLDSSGAQTLLNQGDGLLNSADYNMVRFKGAFVSPDDIIEITYNNKKKWWKRGFK